MFNLRRALLAALMLVLAISWAGAADWYVGPEGKPNNSGTMGSPWDIVSTFTGKRQVKPGDTVWMLAGTYKCSDRTIESKGFMITLAGTEQKPIMVRPVAGERVTLDGGLTVTSPAANLGVYDLEILVSENFTMPRRVEEPGSHPSSYKRPWGGLQVLDGKNLHFIHMVMRDNAQGVSFWRNAVDSEIYGCLILDNGWTAPDRGHGHAIYTQNAQGIKTIADCIITRGQSYSMHAYGSSRADVDNYLIQGNIIYKAGTFLVGGGKPSHNIRVLDNVLYGLSMQIGYNAPENEDCEIRNNLIIGGNLNIKRYKKVVNEGNVILTKQDIRPQDPPRIIWRPSKYDPSRAHLAIFAPGKPAAVAVDTQGLLKKGDAYRLMDPGDFYGKPIAQGTAQGSIIQVPTQGEFTALVLLKNSPIKSTNR